MGMTVKVGNDNTVIIAMVSTLYCVALLFKLPPSIELLASVVHPSLKSLSIRLRALNEEFSAHSSMIEIVLTDPKIASI
ncbi:hypothetical protein CHH28_08215 [Bacterioplanes sanyensis]|uniref:Uncharacterized protein n=1 Tax=Bacterioplanes sanyensis TaxID=1249553 RepID=A0A222FKA7_9GAMM|nr:hypothetical protein CHH28_08215 [Bacterioplanes sanyensis]